MNDALNPAAQCIACDVCREELQMIPRNLYAYILAACVVLTLLGLCVPARTDALATHQGRPGMTKSYCASTVDQPVVYVSGFFDIKTPPGLALSAGPLNFAFHNYLVEEY